MIRDKWERYEMKVETENLVVICFVCSLYTLMQNGVVAGHIMYWKAYNHDACSAGRVEWPTCGNEHHASQLKWEVEERTGDKSIPAGCVDASCADLRALRPCDSQAKFFGLRAHGNRSLRGARVDRGFIEQGGARTSLHSHKVLHVVS